jgi:hypothetical protein
MNKKILVLSALCAAVQAEAAVFMIDFGDDFGPSAAPWEEIAVPTTAAGSYTGTGVSVAWDNALVGAVGSANNWLNPGPLAGVEFPDTAGEDNFQSPAGAGETTTITFTVPASSGGYDVHVLSASKTPATQTSFTITGGLAADATAQGASAAALPLGTGWKAKADGEADSNWLIWNSVAPGSTTITLTFAGTTAADNGVLSAVHLTAVPEPEEYALVAGLALIGFAVWRRRNAAAACS